jgi:hypothetical protein
VDTVTHILCPHDADRHGETCVPETCNHWEEDRCNGPDQPQPECWAHPIEDEDPLPDIAPCSAYLAEEEASTPDIARIAEQARRNDHHFHPKGRCTCAGEGRCDWCWSTGEGISRPRTNNEEV